LGTRLGHCRRSSSRLFALVYLVGTIVTIILSNDATAVVLTLADYAATKQANAKPLPYLFICAFIANAASFVLPISNPANLVVYGGGHMPTLATWLAQFGLASVASIVFTFVVLRLTQRTDLAEEISRDVNWQLGLPTFVAGVATATVILILNRLSPWKISKEISWSVLPLVAGLFVLVALRREGQAVSAWQFLGLGCLVMPPALIAALVTFIWIQFN
jgi:arsenical pump membrane protein